MFFILTKTENVFKFLKYPKFVTIEVNAQSLKDSYKLILVEGDLDIILDFIIEHRVETCFLLPYLSRGLFGSIFGDEVIKDKNLKPTRLSKSILETLIASDQDLLPSFNDEYYYLGDLINGNNQIHLGNANYLLEGENLLLDTINIRVDLKKLLIDSVQKVIKKEKSVLECSIQEIEQKNNDFFMEGITDFLLTAIMFYSKEEIKEFLQKEGLIFESCN